MRRQADRYPNRGGGLTPARAVADLEDTFPVAVAVPAIAEYPLYFRLGLTRDVLSGLKFGPLTEGRSYRSNASSGSTVPDRYEIKWENSSDWEEIPSFA